MEVLSIGDRCWCDGCEGVIFGIWFNSQKIPGCPAVTYDVLLDSGAKIIGTVNVNKIS